MEVLDHFKNRIENLLTSQNNHGNKSTMYSLRKKGTFEMALSSAPTRAKITCYGRLYAILQFMNWGIPLSGVSR